MLKEINKVITISNFSYLIFLFDNHASLFIVHLLSNLRNQAAAVGTDIIPVINLTKETVMKFTGSDTMQNPYEISE